MSTTTANTTEGTSPVVATTAATPAASATVPDFTNREEVTKFISELPEGAATAALAALTAAGASSPAADDRKDDYSDPTATEATPSAPVAEVTPPVVATPETEVDDNPQPEKLGKFRVTARDFKEAEFLRLAKSMPVTEAYAKAYGAPVATEVAAPTPVAPEAAPVAPAPATSAKLTDAQAKLADLETKLTEAQENADLGTVTKLMREISKTERVIEFAEADAVAAQKSQADAVQNTFRQREAAVAQDVYAAFPKLGDPTSAEHAEFKQFIDLKAGDPDYASIFTSPRWVKVMANEFAEAKGWGKAAAPAAPTGNPAPRPGAPTAPRVTAAEVLTPGSTQGGPSVMDLGTAITEIRKQGSEALFAALNIATKGKR